MRRFFITYYTYWEPEEAIDIRAYTLKGAKRKAMKHLKNNQCSYLYNRNTR